MIPSRILQNSYDEYTVKPISLCVPSHPIEQEKIMSEAVILPIEEQKWNIPVVISLALFHIGAVVALFYFNWTNLFLATFLYWIAGGLGICLGYHRLHTHRSYKVPR